LKYNQWANVVRWEFTDATPFLRSREFLWQEGHTCHRTKELALKEVNDILNLYENCYKEVLAIPTIKGYKTEKEKFSGADVTMTIEGYIPGPNKAIQCATSHCLGQNFSKIFKIEYTDEQSKNLLVWQNSWGFTTRSIGVMLITHGDEKGIVYPPFVAPTQIAIIPIIFKNKKENVLSYATEVYEKLRKEYRIKLDTSDHNPGWKQNYWEMLGTPLRFEIGPRDTKNRTIRIVRRDTFEKIDVPFDETFIDTLNKMLFQIHTNLYNIANNKLKESIVRITSWEDFMNNIENKKLCLAPFCNKTDCEILIKEKSGAKSLCIPIDSEYIIDITDKKCVKCNNIAVTHCLFGKSF
jgi:prolyl-tRNA synthetase